MKSQKIYFYLIFFFVVKLALALVVPVFGDETYYYVWSKHPQLSYFDHPGMVSWLIYLSQLLFPAGHVLGLRFGFVLLSFLTSLIWLKILQKRNFSERQLFLFFTFLFLNPLLGLGSIMATPDVGLVFFWSLAYLFFTDLLLTNKLIHYVLLGAALGLGFCSKYHIVLFVLSGLVYLVLAKEYKKIRLYGVFLTLLFGTLFCLPVLIWNSQNNWVSFLFQLNHGFGESTFSISWPLGYLLAQTVIINPFFLTTLFKTNERILDKTFSLTQLGFFFVSSFKSVVEGNWPITSHFHSLSHAIENEKNSRLRSAFVYWLLFYFLLGGFFLSNFSAKARKNLINSAQLSEIYPLVKKYQPLYGASYQVASLISWKTQKDIAKLHLLSRHDFYDSLPESTPTAKQFYVLKYDYSHWPAEYDRYKKIRLESFDNTGLELYQFNYE